MFKLLGYLVLLAILVGGYGLYSGWFSITKTTHAGETKLEVGVNRDEISKDMRKLQGKFSDVLDKLDSDKAVTGTIVKVNKNRRIVLESDGSERKFTLADDAAIEVDGAAARLSALREGDEAVLELEAKGSETVTKIVVRR